MLHCLFPIPTVPANIRTHNCAFVVSITSESTDSPFCPKKSARPQTHKHTHLEWEDFCLLYSLRALCWNEVSIVTLPTFQPLPLGGCYLTLVSEYITKDFVIYLEFTVFSKSDKMFPFKNTFFSLPLLCFCMIEVVSSLIWERYWDSLISIFLGTYQIFCPIFY